MENQFDVIVIGAGPAGYVAAIRCAQLGLKTACIDQWLDEEQKPVLGGTCLNVGCIPSKALLESSYLYESACQGYEQHGIQLDSVALDLEKMMARKQGIVSTLTQGIAGLFKSNQVSFVSGSAKLHTPGQVSVQRSRSDQTMILNASNIILATGSTPVEIPAAPWQDQVVVDSTGALEFTTVPKSIGIIGAGVIGLELGSVWNRLGSKVVLFEAMDSFLPMADTQIAGEALKQYQKQGLHFEFGACVSGSELKQEGVEVVYQQNNKTQTKVVERLIVAVGRRPNSDGLVSDTCELIIDARGFVVVDQQCKTNVEGVYAIGDLVRGPMLAHKGSEEGMMVAERIAGQYAKVNYNNIPSIIYTHPEIAWVGSTENDLKQAGKSYKTGVFPFSASGRARASGDISGMVKVIADAESDRVLGVHMIGSHCSELITQAVIAREFSASAEDLALTIFAHPTLSEAVHEAALAVDNRAIHIAKSGAG
ncbi:Dihydrolipoamide dehydrogenase of 2-oxoglutarate dehydrogenase [hydrothermal vent metagenome]|uniref:Dihydrolipoyl dehydrogenase n=1 Tax=hydrothermal vent metagenome TaxID=652676 RepID=A0A3B0YQU4_9ZZZZ